MSLKPLYDRVVVRRLEAETTTKAGIIIPDKSAEKPTQGEVIAVGDGIATESGDFRSLLVKTGDKVLFGQFSGSPIKLNGEELLILKESDILAIIEEQNIEEKAA